MPKVTEQVDASAAKQTSRTQIYNITRQFPLSRGNASYSNAFSNNLYIEVVYGATVANAAVAYFTINSLRLSPLFVSSRNINKNEEFMGITILLDELVRIVSILFIHYRNDLKDGSIVKLDRFEVARVAEHQFPNNLELMMGLFNCYVCEYSFMKQQQTAIKMYKLAGEERFLLWAVCTCSIKLQVLCDKSGEKLLLLAEGLLKHIASHSMHEPEVLMVYVSLVEQQSKYNDALEVLSGNLGSLLVIEVDKLRIQGRLPAKAHDYSAVYKKNLRIERRDDQTQQHIWLGATKRIAAGLISEIQVTEEDGNKEWVFQRERSMELLEMSVCGIHEACQNVGMSTGVPG
ncbi:hypothetical protein F2Q68_00038589 [Brassica cretica]|uniref:Uncharacterized protein n=1 Tax=Brassica cretica TaxID=69181 RepID=A0A8S9MQL9_BRACR|nr:hypothetical protein F2Q68_00038589 [Brassica cretica]